MKIRLAFKLHWYITFYISLKGGHPQDMSLTSAFATIQERSLINIKHLLILKYNFSYLEVIVKSPVIGHTLLKSMTLSVMVGIILCMLLVYLG